MASWTTPHDRATTAPSRASRRRSARSISPGVSSPAPNADRRATTSPAANSAGPTTTQNTARHDHADASQPATGAPITDGRTHAADTHVKTRGRSAGG